MKKSISLIELVVLVFVCSFAAQAQKTFVASLSGEQEVPTPNPSIAIGVGKITLDADENYISVVLNFNGLSCVQNRAAIYGPASAGEDGGVPIFSFPTFSRKSGNIYGRFSITAKQVTQLRANFFYFNIRNNCYPNGEIRGQIKITDKTSDFDGDGKSDVSIFRPLDGVWYVQTQSGNVIIQQFGQSGDIPIPEDFDGDGKSDFAVWRASTGSFYVLRSYDSSLQVQQWGIMSDDPTVTRDYDGDGKSDFAVYRRASTQGEPSYWHILQSSSGAYRLALWGTSTDLPVPGDYDGDGRSDIAVRRIGANSNDQAYFYLLLSLNNSLYTVPWGLSSDRNVQGDFDGDGKIDIAVWRPANGTYYILKSSGGMATQQWGLSLDRLTTGDYDGDGRADFGVWRPSNNCFYVLSQTGNIIYQDWGVPGDIPTAFYKAH